MWGKLLAGAAVVLAFALAAFLGVELVTAYGDARYAAGKAEAQVAAVPGILAANAAATKAALDGRDRIIAADGAHAAETARLLPLLLQSNEKVAAYAQTDAGRAPCLAADRVFGIEASRAALFPAAAASGADAGGSRPLPADILAEAGGWNAKQR